MGGSFSAALADVQRADKAAVAAAAAAIFMTIRGVTLPIADLDRP
jgi:hypothetical protein